MRCQRCNGQVLRSHGTLSCLQCGWEEGGVVVRLPVLEAPPRLVCPHCSRSVFRSDAGFRAHVAKHTTGWVPATPQRHQGITIAPREVRLHP